MYRLFIVAVNWYRVWNYTFVGTDAALLAQYYDHFAAAFVAVTGNSITNLTVVFVSDAGGMNTIVMNQFVGSGISDDIMSLTNFGLLYRLEVEQNILLASVLVGSPPSSIFYIFLFFA